MLSTGTNLKLLSTGTNRQKEETIVSI